MGRKKIVLPELQSLYGFTNHGNGGSSVGPPQDPPPDPGESGGLNRFLVLANLALVGLGALALAGEGFRDWAALQPPPTDPRSVDVPEGDDSNRAESISFTLDGFDFEGVDLSPSHARTIVQDICPAYDRGDQVHVAGFSDPIGELVPQLVVSRGRADAVADGLISLCNVLAGSIVLQAGGPPYPEGSVPRVKDPKYRKVVVTIFKEARS